MEKVKETNEALREIVLHDDEIFSKATSLCNNTSNEITLANVSTNVLSIDKDSEPINLESPEPPEMPSIWEGSPISPITSPPYSHVDSTELNNEIIEFHVKGPNSQFVNLEDTLMKESKNYATSVDGSVTGLVSDIPEKDSIPKKTTPKKMTEASKKKTFVQARKQSKPITITPSPPEKAAPVPTDDDEIILSESLENVIDEESSSVAPSKMFTTQSDEKEWREKFSEDGVLYEPESEGRSLR